MDDFNHGNLYFSTIIVIPISIYWFSLLGNGDGTGKPLTMGELVAQCFVFFFGGFETSSSTMSFALFELAKKPHIQEKVRQELFDVLEKYDHQLCYESLKDLHYMQQVLDGNSCFTIIIKYIFQNYSLQLYILLTWDATCRKYSTNSISFILIYSLRSSG